jgi:uncharacterized protein YjiS (DUF1127 family)
MTSATCSHERTNLSTRTRGRSPIARLFAALQVRRERLHLAALDEHMLTDIGLTRDEAEAEARLPLWDAPAHWKC